MDKKPWYHDEFKQLGTDYHDVAEVEAYDKRMRTFRDIDGDIESAIKILNLQPDHVLMDIGCGTGDFAIAASKICEKVIAVDISPQMIEYFKQKIANRGVSNIDIIRAGFLSLDYPPESVDRITSTLCLHHLTDFWKIIALQRVKSWLKPGGQFLLRDVIFSFNLNNYEEAIEGWISKAKIPKMEESMAAHIREEFSTTAKIMDIVIEESGLELIGKDYQDGFIAQYLCEKRN